tara:strand:+ start:510 stop:665 length:156 start_codon:yes stop_codon:yes gene_type:complete
MKNNKNKKSPAKRKNRKLARKRPNKETPKESSPHGFVTEWQMDDKQQRCTQ